MSSAVQRRITHTLAALLVAGALVNAVATTWGEQWPAGPDTLRDIASAETIRASLTRTLQHGTPLPDPYYKNEIFWYSPLMPALLAAGAAVTHAPMHLVATRAPIFWNLACPIAFYLLACALFDPLVALVALAVFLFVEPFASREAATYSPALITSSFAQPFFYLALSAWLRFRKTLGLAPAFAAGCLLGLSFLAHTVPTALLAVVFSVETLVWLWQARRSAERNTIALRCAFVAGVGLLFASPGMVPLAHYHLQIRELEPFVYRDPSVAPENLVELFRTNVSAYLFSVPALFGLVALPFERTPRSRRITLTWFLASVALFFWAAYAVRIIEWEGLAKLAIAPAHHFMIYARGAESLLAGVGIVTLARLAGRFTSPAVAWPTALIVAAGLVAASLPHYRGRDAVMIAAHFSEPQQAAIDWMQNKTGQGSVFLAPENTGVSMIGLVRRKTVIVGPVFSNPYVDWGYRDRERQAMWDALVARDCPAFEKHADPFGVTHLLLVDGMTPDIADRTCGFLRVFNAPPFAIFSRIPGEARP